VTTWPAPGEVGWTPAQPPAPLTTVAVVTERRQLSDQVAAALGQCRLIEQQWREGDERFDAERIVKEVTVDDASVVCIGDDVPLRLAFEVASVVDRDHPETAVVLVAAPSTELWRDALRAGVRDVIDPHRVDIELEPAMRRAFERTARRRQQRLLPSPSTPPAGRVIVMLSAKGGSGKTMVASNLAVALARMVEGSVALVDLDVQFGDSATALSLVPEHTIGQLATAPVIDPMTLKVYLTPHEPSGAFVLCGSESPAEGEVLTDVQAARIIQLLARDFSCVVVDTPAGLDERTLAAIELATDVVFIATMDVSSIRNMAKEVAALDRLGLLRVNRHFVLNRADARVGIDVADVERALGMTVDVAVPSNRSIPLSMNQGRPIVIDEPASPVSRELLKLAHRVAGDEFDENERKPRFLRRRK
jgi:pilus assembly protein CpaE